MQFLIRRKLKIGIKLLKINRFNSVLIYLRASLTAHKPVTNSARLRRMKLQQNTCKQNIRQGNLYGNSNNNNSVTYQK